MTKFFSFFTVITLLMFACTKKQANTTETVTDSLATNKVDTSTLAIDSTIEASFSDIKHFATYSEDFQLLVASLDGVFRGINLQMSKEEVKKLEADVDATLVKETADALNYKVSLGEGETATIMYTFKAGKVDKINVEVRVNTLELYEALNAELIDYYTKKFGEMVLENKQEKWKISETHNLMVHDVMKTKTDFYILIEVK
jgi:hypothetical protein